MEWWKGRTWLSCRKTDGKSTSLPQCIPILPATINSFMLLFFCSTSMCWTPLDAEMLQHKSDRLTPVPVPHLSLKVAQSCPTLWPHELCPWSSPGKNTGVGSLSLLQGIFLTQGSNPISCIAGGSFTNWAIREAPSYLASLNFHFFDGKAGRKIPIT